jgi:hypothetical protein
MPLYNLDWFDARDLARHASYQVRRMSWSSGWLQYYRGLWYYRPGVGAVRVVQSDDFDREDFLAADWTTCAYSADPCFTNLAATEAELQVLAEARAANLSGQRNWGGLQLHPPPPLFVPPA